MKKIELKDIWKYGRSPKSYPIWRRPLVIPSFYVSYFLVKAGLKRPTLLSILMIIVGVSGASLLFFNVYWFKVLGCGLILFSYFIDLMDGKVARMIGKANKTGKFLDWNYHVTVSSIALFGIGFSSYTNTGRTIYLLLGFVCAWAMIMKTYMHSTYLHFLRDINLKKGVVADEFERESDKEYNRFIKGGMQKFYNYFGRLFFDATDLWFLLLVCVLFRVDRYLLIVLGFLYLGLFLVSFYLKYRKLYETEEKT